MRKRTRSSLSNTVRAHHPSDASKSYQWHHRQTSSFGQSQTQIQLGQDQGGSSSPIWQRGHRLRTLTPKRQSAPNNKSQGTARNGGTFANKSIKNQVFKASKASRAPPRTSTSMDPGPTDRVRDKQQQIIDIERQERQGMVERYISMGDPREFAAFLRPFIPPVELGEWQWDDEVQRWWREDRATGRRIWGPVNKSFL
ncbi:hypothetical protein C8A03DRAFT_41097 [Achaetomium macrosporum]|uniref:Uncharacterized protein n=1 Tax=Achaetomium macrosporum TaxID=79813 RepID=A0AAN7CG63_9PEZI|nr:hypothetical protein C8A03DRAFT_41097 [Achaetomium macrosporum]